jgi:hypothetical protein
MNSTEFVICYGIVSFSLDNQWKATPKSVKVTLTLTYLSLITLSNVQMQKG